MKAIKHFNRFAILLIAFLLSNTLSAQNYEQQGDELFEQANYEKAVKKYAAAKEICNQCETVQQKYSKSIKCRDLLNKAQKAELEAHFDEAKSYYSDLYSNHPLSKYQNKSMELSKTINKNTSSSNRSSHRKQIEHQYSMFVTDCQGHTYPVVKIGNQYWMAENLQCTKYDSKSECAGATLSNTEHGYKPYYYDGRNAVSDKSNKCDNLTSTDRKKLGLLYNWAATVGLLNENAIINQTTDFNKNRQGICPNGWHVPSITEWRNLINGKKSIDLMSQSGWTEDSYDTGTDIYAFSALPAGFYEYKSDKLSGFFLMGKEALFWSTTPNEFLAPKENATNISLSSGSHRSGIKPSTFDHRACRKSNALAVRCVKD